MSGPGAVLTRVTAVVVLAAVVLMLLVWAFQRRLIYLPSREPVPAAARLLPRSEEVSFSTEDGLRLAGWFVPGVPGAATVLMFNGNSGDRSARAPLAAALARTGVSVLLFDYRGYGGNPGSPSEARLAADARAARDYLDSRSEVRSESVVYYGESLGAGVAIGLAAERPPAALVLRSPFTSLADVGRRHYPYLPVRQLLKDRYDSIGRIADLRCPILVVAGGADTIVPAGQSRRLYDAAPTPKRYVEIPGAGHNDLALLAGDALIREVLAVLPRRNAAG